MAARKTDDPRTQTQEPRAADSTRDADKHLALRRVFPKHESTFVTPKDRITLGDEQDAIPDDHELSAIHHAAPENIFIKPKARVTFGREHAAVIVEDHRVSRTHCEVLSTPTGYALLDLDSKNGTWLNGHRLRPRVETKLTDGAVLRLGDTLFVARLVRDEQPDPTDSDDPLLPGRAPGVIAARQELRQLAAERDPVLITGETGTGKELAARILHRANTPLIPVNCSELTPAIARAELFGTERGAFTDAAERAGLIAQAQNGVLFLDEIGELDLGVQAELLRFLEDGRYRKVGGSELLESTARVVAATNVDLEAAARAGRFRRDLLARLRRAARAIELPPLRDRREDLLDWSHRFLEKHGLTPKMSAAFAERILLHSWPENLRELDSVLRSAARRAGGELLDETHLDGLLEPAPDAEPDEDDPVLDIERETLKSALRATHGNLKKTADRLNIERTKLYRAIRKLGIDVKIYRDDGG